YKDNINKKRINSPKYYINNIILLNTINLANGRLYTKFSPRWKGPFRIVRTNSYIVYLSLPANIKYLLIFYVFII
ncbi:hypothetical protein NEUTE2DRAFT_59298, partial [Neurospora tetrasperma FGSC 2509]